MPKIARKFRIHFLGPGELLGKTTKVKLNARTVIWNEDLSCVEIYIY